MAKITVTADTPFDEVKTSRRNTVKLAQAVHDRVDTDFFRAFTQFGKLPELGRLIAAKRDGSFDVGQLFVHGPKGPVFPSAASILTTLDELDENGEVSIDGDAWKSMIACLELGDGFKMYDGSDLESEEQLFEAAFGGGSTKKTKPKKKPTPKKPRKSRAKAPAPAPEPPTEPEESAAPTEVNVNLDGVVEMIAGGLEALDKRIMDRLDTTDEELKAGLADLVGDLHERMDMMFGGIQLLAGIALTTYRRQQELDIVIDPHGEFPEISDETEEELEALITFDPNATYEPPEEGTDRSDADQADDAPADEEGEPEEGEPEEPEDEPQADDAPATGDVLTITKDMKKLSQEDFVKKLESHDSVYIPNFPEGKGILSALSVEKLRELAEFLGVENAKSINYKMLIISRIGSHLGIDGE